MPAFDCALRCTKLYYALGKINTVCAAATPLLLHHSTIIT